LSFGALNSSAGDANRFALRLGGPDCFVERDCPRLRRRVRPYGDLSLRRLGDKDQGREERSYRSGRVAATGLILY
jgi:hypothetical protein